MLKTLHISNYAIIEEVNISLDSGLSIITGETGAGKSILLGALGLVMGKRADTSVLFTNQKKCIVEAIYDISGYKLKPFFSTKELDYDQECIVRREISPSGKSRAFINDTPVTLTILKDLSVQLVDLHQQFDQLDINEEASQINALDAVSENLDLVLNFKKEFIQYRKLISSIDQIKSRIKQNAQEEDYLTFQLKEFEELELKENEVEELEKEQNLLNNSEEIKRIGGLLDAALNASETSITETIDQLIRELRAIVDVDPTASEIRDKLMNAKEEISDIAQLSSRMSEEIEYNPNRISEIEERLNLINRILNKYNVQSSSELMEIEEKLVKKYESFNRMDQNLDDLEREASNMEKELIKSASTISNNRSKGAKKLQDRINSILHDLSMKNAQLKIEINKDQAIREMGTDKVTFLFSANKGSSFLPLSKVASGGELSRINLALKSTIAGALTLPTLIFDEIDSGVSGQVALMMGKILKKLSLDHQTICITHSPQIAAQADVHYKIYKTDKENRTFTHVSKLDDIERRVEIAKMLSGDPPSEEALNNAKQLLQLT